MTTQRPKKRVIDRAGLGLQAISIAGIIALGGLFLAATSEPVWGAVLLVLGLALLFAVWRRLDRN